MEFKYCKLEIFLPPTHLEVVQKALQEVDAGHIGNYDSCMSVSPVTGYWRPLDGCNPYIGTNGEISCEPELKVEVTVYTENVDKTIEAVKKVHPYEEFRKILYGIFVVTALQCALEGGERICQKEIMKL